MVNIKMVNIKGFPLLHEEECREMFSADMSFSGYYFIKPIYKWLPDFKELDDEEKAKYIFKNLKQDMYLVGLEIISEKWVNKGFCAMLLETYGLVLCEANPMEKKGDRGDEESLIFLSFKHIAFAVHPVSVSVS